MSNCRPYIDRIRDNGVQTLSRFTVYKGDGLQYQCVALEPSWVLNQPYISCAPTGKYPFKKRTSQKYGAHFEIERVPNRTFMLIHTLNYYKQSEGCVGVGQRFKYMNEDNQVDITESRKTLDYLLKILPDEGIIHIRNHENFQRFYNQANDTEMLMEGLR